MSSETASAGGCRSCGRFTINNPAMQPVGDDPEQLGRYMRAFMGPFLDYDKAIREREALSDEHADERAAQMAERAEERALRHSQFVMKYALGFAGALLMAVVGLILAGHSTEGLAIGTGGAFGWIGGLVSAGARFRVD